MTWYFIRHDPKMYDNGKGIPKFDPGLLNINDDIINEKILNNFKPEIILCSPFLRCRETTKRYYPSIECIIDINLSEYLGNWKRDILKLNLYDFNIDTFNYIISCKSFKFEKDINFLKNRLYKFVSELEEIYKSKNVLIVTHGLILQIIRIILKEKNSNIRINNFFKNSKYGFKVDI